MLNHKIEKNQIILIAILSALPVLVAHLSEIFLGLVPCKLCLLQRIPYYVAFLISVSAIFLENKRYLLIILTAVCFDIAVLISGFHIGVEYKLWPSPFASCSSMIEAGKSVDDLLRSLPATPGVPCDEPVYMFSSIPISMAMMNFFYGSTLFAITIYILVKATKK